MNRYPLLTAALAVLIPLFITGCGDGGTERGVSAGRLAEVARVVARREDRVAADDLARWFIEERRDFVLIDVRPAPDYAEGHIDDAINLPLARLVTGDQLPALAQGRRIVVYSQGSELAGQAVVLLRLAGYDADLLLGGYNFWRQRVSNPAIQPTRADGEYPRVPEQQAIACYFVGGERPSQAPARAPEVKVPAFVPPVSRPAPPRRRAADEGC